MSERTLILKSSILGQYSQSNKLIDHLTTLLSQAGKNYTVRDLATDALPVLDEAVIGSFSAGDSLTDAQQQLVTLSDGLIEELSAHQTLVIAAPMYNFHIPTQLKNWIDLVARAGVTFRYTENGPEGLIKGKKVIIITTRGGIHKDSPTDVMIPYLKTVLGFIGLNDVEVIYGEGLAMGDEFAAPSVQQAQLALESLSIAQGATPPVPAPSLWQKLLRTFGIGS